MKTLEQIVGSTPLVQLQSLGKGRGSEILVKLEGNNPAGSVKDRAALSMIQRAEARGEGKVLDQFNNPDNPYAHYVTTGPEIWQQTAGRITHFVSSMGTTGTITGVSQFMSEQNKTVKIVGLQPEEGSSIPGIRRWSQAYMPGIFNASLVDSVLDISQREAENTMRALAV